MKSCQGTKIQTENTFQYMRICQNGNVVSTSLPSSSLGLFCKVWVFLTMAWEVPICSKNSWIQTWLKWCTFPCMCKKRLDKNLDTKSPKKKTLVHGRYEFDDYMEYLILSRDLSYSTAIQNKCRDIGMETKISGLKVKIKIQTEV